MNLYFWFFAVWAFLITPVRLRADLLIGRGGMRYQLRLQVAGLTLMRNDTQDEHALAERSHPADPAFWLGLIRQGALKKLRNAFRIQALDVYARISFPDAAHTAEAYAFVRTIAESLQRCGALQSMIHGRITADFQAQDTEILLRGIFVSRLGNLGLAAAQLGLAVLRTRLLLAEEESHAASH